MSSLSSLTTIIGPLIVTQLFGWFTGPRAPVVFAGAPYGMAAVFLLVALVVFVAKVRPGEKKRDGNCLTLSHSLLDMPHSSPIFLSRLDFEGLLG